MKVIFSSINGKWKTIITPKQIRNKENIGSVFKCFVTIIFVIVKSIVQLLFDLKGKVAAEYRIVFGFVKHGGIFINCW